MQSIPLINTDLALERIRSALRTIDALRLPRSVRPHLEIVLVRKVSRIMDQALPWQQGHGRRTAVLAQAIGTAAGLGQEGLHHLTLAALLHDIGLLALPSRLHAYSEPLDSESYTAVQCHPRTGAQWLEPFGFLRNASVIIAHHHERWDGSGYPYGIRGTFIPLEARVLAVADAFDAIQVPGATDQQMRDRVAYRILTVSAGTQFDPRLIAACGHCLQRSNIISPFN
jgi:HD-GYP domain-containing protein (c-di-GMP phosphodiesterase class II)